MEGVDVNAIRLLHSLNDEVAEHALWANPLLTDCAAGRLSFEEVSHLLSQYCCCLESAAKLLVVTNVSIIDAAWVDQLVNKLMRHVALLQKILSDKLNVVVHEILPASFSIGFVENHLSCCLQAQPLGCVAVLARTVEAIMPRFNVAFAQSLVPLGFVEPFFERQVDAELTKGWLSFVSQADWYECSSLSLQRSLDLWDEFFSALYVSIYGSVFSG